MKRKIITVLMLIFGFSGVFAQNSELPFSYDKQKAAAQTGTCFVYTTSNMDKDQSYEFYIYQEDEKTFLSLYDLSSLAPLIQIGKQIYNSECFCYDYFYNTNPYTYAKMRNSNGTTEGFLDIEAKKIHGTMTYINLLKKEASISGNVELLSLPSYEISGGQTDLWFSMRFLKSGIKEFTVGVYTVLKAQSQKVTYAGVETVNGKSCDKWEAVVLDKKGNPKKEKQIFWFDRSDSNYNLVKTKIHMSGTVFENTLIELKEKKQYTKAEWESFVKAKTEEVRIKLDIPAK